MPGIKVDGGTRPLAGFPGEVATQGLDGLRERLDEYALLGLRFAKWRAVIRVGDGLPTDACVEANAHELARYAIALPGGRADADRRTRGADGRAHTTWRPVRHVTERVLREVYAQLGRQRVALEATLLKPNMVLPGSESDSTATDAQIARATVEVLRRTVPAAVPGVLFLSGGQSDEQATARLDAINRLGAQPWELSFSFGRALQAPVLHAWAGTRRTAAPPRTRLLKRARLNGAARQGRYDAQLEQ